ncbi:MAG TPA: phosphatase PAP2 family protein [Kofleriaceae bacterium]|nr:phosphatase PAP2 family protein [Kofleriaceae bacterium]
MRAPLAAILLLASAASAAHADPAGWYQGSAGRRRSAHLVAIVAGGALYISSETFLKEDLAPSTCRRCGVSSFDGSVRDAAVWEDTGLAAALSNLDGYFLSPVVALGLTVLGAPGGVRGPPGRWMDDTIPIVEAGILAGLINQTVKFAVGRQRPFVHFADSTRAPGIDDNLSFYSGHTTLAFSIATSAGVVAHRRRSQLEPLIWSTGYAFAATTGYLRIAADRHYFTDVITGAVAGAAIGLAVPLLLHPHLGDQIQIVPAGRGIAVLGRF